MTVSSTFEKKSCHINFKILTPSLGWYSMHHWMIRMQFTFLLNHHFKWSVENTCINFQKNTILRPYWRKYYALLIRALLDNFLAIVYSSMLLDVIFHLLLFLTLTVYTVYEFALCFQMLLFIHLLFLTLTKKLKPFRFF